jgi:putative endonuclease
VAAPVTYLVHLDRPLGGPVHFAQHYLGTTQNLDRRLETHRAGLGARILAAANERGIAYDVVRTWDGGREVERRLKARHAAPRMCPTCVPSREVT